MEELDRKTLIQLLKSYNNYIQEANEENRYGNDWFPVCIMEYYHNEFQESLE